MLGSWLLRVSSTKFRFKPILFMLWSNTLAHTLNQHVDQRTHAHNIRDITDISFNIPDAVAVSVKNFINNDNTCPITGSTTIPKNKRIPGDLFRCLVVDAEDLIDELSPIGDLASLFNELQAGTIAIPAQGANFADEPTDQALSYVLAYAGARIPLDRPGISTATIQAAALMSFYITYSFVFNMAASTLQQIIIYQDVLTTPGPGCIAGWKPRCENQLCGGQGGLCTGASYFSGCPCDNKPCPSSLEDSLRCSMDCGGADSSGKCLGDAEGNYKGCDCVLLWDVPLYDATEHEWEDITGIIATLPLLVLEATTTCNPTATDTWTYGPAAELAVKLFCANSTNLAGQNGEIRKQQYSMGTVDDIVIKVTLNDAASATVTISQDICFSTLWNILNCPRSGSNVYGGISQMPSNASTFAIVPNGGVPTIKCDPVDPPYLSGSPSSYKVALNRDSMTSVYDTFCDASDGKDLLNGGKINEVHGPFGGLPVEKHQNIRITAEGAVFGNIPEGCANWDGILKSDTCKLVFGMLTDKCDPDTRIGKRGGGAIFECIEWHIDGYTSTADIYQLHVHQQMVDDFSQIEWTLYDSRGTVVGGPSTDGTVTGAAQTLSFHIDSPTDKDKTNVRMFYPGGGKFQFSTGWTGKSSSADYRKEYYCDDILDGGPGSWVTWQSNGRNGFERQFDCFFRGWGNNDGDVI